MSLPTACPLDIAPLVAAVVPQKQSIAVEEMGNYVLTVTNQGRQKVSLMVVLCGVNQHWVMISPRYLTVGEGDSAKIVVTISPPRISACRAGDYQLRFILCEPSTSGASWHGTADLTIEPFSLSPELSLGDNNHKVSKRYSFQRLLLIPLLLFSCILISIFAWAPFRGWAMGSQEFRDSFGLALLETTAQASTQSPPHGTESGQVLHDTASALGTPIVIAPNWSPPLSSPTPLPPITFIPPNLLAKSAATATSTQAPYTSPLPKPTSLPTATSIAPNLLAKSAATSIAPNLLAKSAATSSPTALAFFAQGTPSATVREAPTTTRAASPTESPTTIATTIPPESDSRLFASSPTSLMIEPAITGLTYEQMFREIGAQYAIDWRLLASVAYQESSLNPLAVGNDDEMGLMQILPTTWDEFAPEVGVSEPFDPYSNVQVGAAYLNYLRGYLVSQGYGEEYWTLVAYNWGPQNMRNLMQQGGNWGDVPPSRQNYAYKIIETVNNNNNDWISRKLKEYISATSQ